MSAQRADERPAAPPGRGGSAETLPGRPRSAPPPAGGVALPAALLSAAASGALMFLANPPVQFEPAAFVALVPLLWALRRSRPRRGWLLAFVFGAVYFGATLYWIALFGTLAWSSLSLASAGILGLAGILTPLVWRDERPVLSVLGIAALWAVVEYLRALWPLGGFTWGGLGYTQPDNGFLMPLASVTGVWGMSFVVAAVNGLVLLAVDAIVHGRSRAAGRWGSGPRRATVVLGFAATLVLVPGLIPIPAPHGPRLDVAILQGNDIEHRLPDPFVEDRRIAANFGRLQLGLAGNPPDLSVWPEDALDEDPALVPAFGSLVHRTVGAVDRPALIGAITGPPAGVQFNEGLLYDGRARLVDRYRKVHLVPFGEYVPWRSALGWISALRQIPRDLTPGVRPHTVACPAGDAACGRLAGMSFATVICYENTFPSLDRRLVDEGAEFLVVQTNNASYGRTAASRQHLIMSRLRAVENGRWVVHAAISGISAFVDPHGGVHRATGLFSLATDRMSIRASTGRTLYTRLGDWFPWASGAAVLGLIAWPRRRRRTIEPGPLPVGARALVVLPTYNERATIRPVVERTLAAAAPAGPDRGGPALPVDVLVVDDGSPDGTAAIARELAAADPRVRLLERHRKEGLAAAYAAGFEIALAERYDVVVEMDADLSHLPEELPRLLEGVGHLDLAIGSRYVPGGSVTNWGRLRLWLSRAGNAYTRVMLGIPVRDATSGYRAFRRPLLETLLAGGIHSDGYGFQIELAYRAWQRGAAVGEVPITFREREHGHSKISRRIVVEALALVTGWGIRDRLRWRPEPGIAPSEASDPDSP
ncbi:MAG: apolipoprotein N-acyltransferase [Actinomycetota bacterium]